MLVPRMTDRYVLEIGKEVKFTFRPLTASQKAESMIYLGMDSGIVLEDRIKMVTRVLKYSLVGCEGLKDYEEQEYELEFDDNGMVLERCIDEICNIPAIDKLIIASFNIITGVKETLYDPFTMESIEGAKFVIPKKKASPGKPKA